MVYKIEELRKVPDEVLITLHDEIAVHTSVGIQYYLDELRRREEMRTIEAANRLARASFWLTLVNSVVAVIAVVVAVLVAN